MHERKGAGAGEEGGARAANAAARRLLGVPASRKAWSAAKLVRSVVSSKAWSLLNAQKLSSSLGGGILEESNQVCALVGLLQASKHHFRACRRAGGDKGGQGQGRVGGR